MHATISTLIKDLNFPEGPAVDSQGNIWLVELKGGNLVCRSPDKTIKKYPVNGAPNGIAVDGYDNIWFCDALNDCISKLNIQTSFIETVCSKVYECKLNHPNDLAFDTEGCLLFTCPGDSRQKPTGYICALGTEENKIISKEKFFPNGLAFTPHGDELIISETYKHRLWKGKWDKYRKIWYEEKPWVEVGGPIGPDGMAFDEEGNLFVAIYGQQVVKVISPKGKIIDAIRLPGKNPSNCAFHPDGGLLVTETEKGELLFIDNHIKGCKLFKKK